MTVVMAIAKHLGVMRAPHPPEQITARTALETTGSAPRGPVRVSALLAHLGFGAAAGAVFGAVAGRRADHLASGAAFGTTVWIVSYCGWIPALDLMPRPTRDEPGRAATMIAAHLVYGTTLAALLRPISKQIEARG
jgi:hypothetical protein